MDESDFDILLPSQFAGRLGGRAREKKGEWRLLAAVLDDAVECFQKHLYARGKEERLLFQEAEHWMMGTNEAPVRHAQDRLLSFSFQYVCDVLDINADYLRSGLRRWRQKQPVPVETPSVLPLDPRVPMLPHVGEATLPQPCALGQPE